MPIFCNTAKNLGAEPVRTYLSMPKNNLEYSSEKGCGGRDPAARATRAVFEFARGTLVQRIFTLLRLSDAAVLPAGISTGFRSRIVRSITDAIAFIRSRGLR